jgi:Tol biopolymer transport system component/DNA-directed RNA polymerase specialized sigma24 family protein
VETRSASAAETEKDGLDLREAGRRLHARYLAERDGAANEITEIFLPLLVYALGRRFRHLPDPHLVATVANDALIGYFISPEKFDPEKGSLIGYLYLDAYRNLLNAIRHEKLMARRFAALEEDLPQRAEAQTPEDDLIEGESSLLRQLEAIITDPVDWQIVQLMIEGVRDTLAYAEVLGISHLSATVQAATVKRHKDRLKAKIRRRIRLGRALGVILALMLTARAAIAKSGKVISLVLALAFLLGVNVYLRQKAIQESTMGNGALMSAQEEDSTERPSETVSTATDFVEKIFFNSDRARKRGTNQWHIWMISPDGSGLEQVTSGDVVDKSPAISPDGTRLAFSRKKFTRDPEDMQPYSIWIKDLISGEETPVTLKADLAEDIYSSSQPAWSPDGTRIAFARSNFMAEPGSIEQMTQIWVVDVLPAVGSPARITEQGPQRASPSWTPDGLHIIYRRHLVIDRYVAIYRINLDTGIEEEIIPPIGDEYDPHYSPDGTKIAWFSFRHSLNGGEIYVADVSNPGETQTRVTRYSGWGGSAWSPDGSRVVASLEKRRLTDKSIEAFVEWKRPVEGVGMGLKEAKTKEFLIEEDLSMLIKSAIGEQAAASYATWIIRSAESNRDIWIVKADGSLYQQLTSGPANDESPCWGRVVAGYFRRKK